MEVYLLKEQEEPFLCFLSSSVCACVTVAGIGKDLQELKAYFTDNC